MLKNCEVCGRVFAHPTRVLCEDCYNEVQAKYRAVKEYLQKNPEQLWRRSPRPQKRMWR